MSFRKRNVGISRTPLPSDDATTVPQEKVIGSRESKNTQPPFQANPGVRPSPIDGRLTTSTGCSSLDGLLAGHNGLALGNSLLIEENGTTDYAGALIKYYAAEGVVQGHHVHVVGFPEAWGRNLPGLIGTDGDAARSKSGATEQRSREKMKIAWRYEGLGDFGEKNRAAPPAVDRGPPGTQEQGAPGHIPTPFCHTFDLAKRLSFPPNTQISYIPMHSSNSDGSPFTPVISHLTQVLPSSKDDTIHRLVIPTLLSPALYPPQACEPRHVLQFLHILRGLLRRYPRQLTAIISLPLELFPRFTGLVRWMEHVLDGVLELTPFPHAAAYDAATSTVTTSGAATSQEEKPQGMVKIHKLPIFHERGGGDMGNVGSGGFSMGGLGDDLAFTVSRRRFVIKPFSLPPEEGDVEAQKGNAKEGEQKLTGKSMEF